MKTVRQNASNSRVYDRWGALLAPAALLLATGWGVPASASGTSWTNSSVKFGAHGMSGDTLGNVFVTGIGEVGIEPPYCYTAAYSKAGTLKWNSVYSNFDAAYGLVVAPDGTGGAATAGYTYAMNPTTHMVYQVLLVVKYNSTGGVVWSQTYSGSSTGGAAQASAVTVDSSGNVYIAGQVANSGTGNDLVTIKFAAATGAPLWIQTWDDTTHGSDFGTGIALDGSGNVYSGGTQSGGSSTGILLKYNATTGAPVWSSNIAVGTGQSIAVNGANVYVGTGACASKFSASTGALAWSTTTSSAISQVGVDTAGDVISIGGNTFPGGPPAGGSVLTRLNPATGGVLWQVATVYPSGKLAVDGAGNSFVSATNSSTNALVAQKYNLSGALLDLFTQPTPLSSTSNIGVATDGANDAFMVGLAPDPPGGPSTSSIYVVGLLGF